jgi:hypothetical protein
MCVACCLPFCVEILDLKACWRLGSLYSQQNPFTSSGPYYSYFPSSPSFATYSAFAYLQSLPRLHTLSLSRIYCLADNDIAVLPRRLKVLDVSFCFHITDHVYSQLPSALTELYCQGCDLITFDLVPGVTGATGPPAEGEGNVGSTEGVGFQGAPRQWQLPVGGDREDATRPLAAAPATVADGAKGEWRTVGRAKGREEKRRSRPKLRVIRGEWSLPERCCVP